MSQSLSRPGFSNLTVRKLLIDALCLSSPPKTLAGYLNTTFAERFVSQTKNGNNGKRREANGEKMKEKLMAFLFAARDFAHLRLLLSFPFLDIQYQQIS